MSDEKIILLTEYGSRAHGTNTEFSDNDYMGIFVEPKEYVTGILHMDTQERKSAVKGERSGVGDQDTTLYPMRKWSALAAKGNPTVLTPLFKTSHESITGAGKRLIANRDIFLSKECGERFLGYMISQRKAMLGLRNKKTNRPELVHTHGFDSKFAYHMLRLGIQGQELMNTGKLTLPMRAPDIDTLMGVRNGEYTKDEVIDWSYSLEGFLRDTIDSSTLPNHPDIAAINVLLHDIYMEEWRS